MKTRNIFILVVLSICLLSCGNEFLNIYPTNKDSKDEFYKTESQMYQALIGAYDPLQWTDFYGGYNQIQFMSDLRSDDIFVGGDIGSRNFFHEMIEFEMDPLDSPRSLWECFYIGINRCNSIIQRMDGVEEISDTNRDRFLAEAYFLRAYYYHWLWKFWGNVPYYDKELEAPYLAKQLSADEIYGKIMMDIDHATEKNGNTYKLPKSVAATEYGRVTIWAAFMLKARVVMYQNDESRYEELYSNLKEIYYSQQFALATDFEALWDDESEFNTQATARGKTESIWEINHKAYGGSWDYPQGGYGTVYPKFIGINGLTGDPDYQEGWGFAPIRSEVYNLYPESDIRKDGGIINFAKRKAILAESGTNIDYTPRADDTGFFNRKYTARKGYNDAPWDVELNFQNNVRIFRYSEALLNLTELALKIGRPANEAQLFFDLVRNRAFPANEELGYPAYNTSHPYYKQATEEAVFEERRLEFVGEGMRFWDIVRTGRTHLLTETNAIWSRVWNDNWKYLPISPFEIDATPAGEYKLKQNPGY